MNSDLLRWLVLLVLGGVIVSGCGAQTPTVEPTKIPPTATLTKVPITPKLDQVDPSIRGVITDIYMEDGKITGIYVMGMELEENPTYDSAAIRFSDSSAFYEKRDSQYIISSTEKLEVAQTVEVLFANPTERSVAEEVVITAPALDNPLIPKLDQEDPHIRGVITDVSLLDGEIRGIFVQGKLEPDTRYDAASIGLGVKQRVFKKKGEGYIIASPEDLAVGQTVEVLFIGAVGTSAPPQATAEEVVILTEE